MDDVAIVDLLGQVGSLFASSLDLKETIDFMLKAASRLVACDATTVFLLDDDEQGLSGIATHPFTEEVARVARFRLGEGIVGWVASHRQPVSIPDATADARFKSLSGEGEPRSLLALPLESPQRLEGVLTLARRQVRPFTDLEVALVRVLANQSAIAIDSARLHAAQRRQLAEIEGQRRELEAGNAEIKEISKRKSQFLAGLSHELRTPLNAILGFSEILKDGLIELSPEQQRDCLESIHQSGRHLLELVNNVLDLSKIEAGRMELSCERFEVRSTIQEVLSVTRALSERRQIEVHVDIEPEGLSVIADRNRLKQVLFNLVSNALKFTEPQGRVRVSARAEGAGLLLEVEDTGQGIPAGEQEVIFTEFHQLPQPRAIEGTGLGLPLSRRIIELHGGTITVRSQPGQGSTFTVRLPLAPPGGAAGADHARGRILLVEDDPGSRELVSMVLSSRGLDLEMAADAEEGLRKLRSSVYDLVLMDLKLPGMDGLTLTRMLRSEPATAGIPVVALSAQAMKGDEQRALAAGCAGYIAKPFEVAGFADRIIDHLPAAAR